jgi:ABC-type polysaccharide/polyol phosphate export permease
VHLCILPLSIIPWAMLSLGIGLICAVFFTFFRDVRPIVHMVMMFTFFSSPILFKIDFFDNHTLQAFILKFHPMTYFAFLFQKPIYYTSWPSVLDWGITLSISTAVVIVGCYLVHRFQGRFYFYL